MLFSMPSRGVKRNLWLCRAAQVLKQEAWQVQQGLRALREVDILCIQISGERRRRERWVCGVVVLGRPPTSSSIFGCLDRM